ncbi:MAG: PIN domain-containing protein [Pirellulales bacterium]
MVIIVVDTTETFKEPLLTGTSWAKIHLLVKKGVAKLVFPRIVRDETAKHFRQHLSDTIATAKRDVGRICKLLRDESVAIISDIDLDAACKNYDSYLDSRLKEFDAQQPDYTNVCLERIAQRAIHGKKPFDAKGRGFKDAILWEHVGAIASEAKSEVALVTNNSKDFCDGGLLAEDLCADLASRGVIDGKVVICCDLNDAFERFGKPKIQLLSEIRHKIECNEFLNFSLESFFAEAYETMGAAVENAVSKWNFTELGHLTRKFLEQPKLASLADRPSDSAVGEVFRIDEGELAFEINYRIEGEIECIEVHYLADEIPPFEDEFRGKAAFTVVNSVIVEEETGQVLEHGIDEVTIEPGYSWPCDDRD